jgi:hypothetical protein
MSFRFSFKCASLGVFAVAALAGCSTEQAYDAGQNAARPSGCGTTTPTRTFTTAR